MSSSIGPSSVANANYSSSSTVAIVANPLTAFATQALLDPLAVSASIPQAQVKPWYFIEESVSQQLVELKREVGQLAAEMIVKRTKLKEIERARAQNLTIIKNVHTQAVASVSACASATPAPAAHMSAVIREADEAIAAENKFKKRCIKLCKKIMMINELFRDKLLELSALESKHLYPYANGRDLPSSAEAPAEARLNGSSSIPAAAAANGKSV